jgi:hypothetical protein
MCLAVRAPASVRPVFSSTSMICIPNAQGWADVKVYFLHRAYTLNGSPRWVLAVGATLMYVFPYLFTA